MKTTSATRTALEQPAIGAPTEPPRVLIVDSDESSRSVLAVVLGREGFETFTASSSEEAMRLLSPGRTLPQLAVVSSELRGEDGFSFVAQLRGDRRTGAMPVMLLARANEAHTHELSRVVGVDEIVFKPAYARDIAALAHVQLAHVAKDQARSLSTFTLPITHLLRAVLATTGSGVIELEHGRGQIAYRRGKVLDAHFDDLHGINGLVRGLALARGEYRVIARPMAFDPAFHCTLKELVSVVVPRLNAWDQLLARCLPLDAKLAVDFGALAKALPSMPDAINGVVRLFDGLRDVRAVLMDSPLDETTTLEIATRLYLMGVVVSVNPDEQSGLAKADPHLFEPRPTEALERMDALFTVNPTPIHAPVEAPQAGEGDWFRDAKGTGLEVDDPSEGWSTAQTVQLTPELTQQLVAFNIQPIVDVQPAPVFAADLMEFAAGELASEAPPMETALAAPLVADPIPLVQVEIREVNDKRLETALAEPSQESDLAALALENEFFSITETQAPARPIETESVSQAVLGLSVPTESRTDSAKFGGLLVACLLIMGTSITAWLLAQSSADLPLPTSSLSQLLVDPPAPTPGVDVQPLEPIFQEPSAQVDPSAALIEATRLYDTGKIIQALKALEELVTTESSSSQAWLMLGLARYDSGNAPGAEEAANTVLALDPKSARAHLLLATIHLDGNRRAEANDEIQKYLDQDPNGTFADEAKALLKR